MTTIVADDAPQADDRHGGHRVSVAATWTNEQAAYAAFLKTARVRLEIIAVEIGVDPRLIDDFVRDALVTIHHAKHTLARGGRAEAWIETIARNLAHTATARRRVSIAGRSSGRCVHSSDLVRIETAAQRAIG